MKTCIRLNFAEQITKTFGASGKQWLKLLPKYTKYAEDKWQLENITTVKNLSFNYVAFGFSRLFDTAIVLKISPEISDFNSEKSGLQYFQGPGVNKLLAYDDAHCISLLEKIGDGVTAKSLFPERDDEAINAAIQVIQQLHSNYIHDDIPLGSYPTVKELVYTITSFKNPVVPLELLLLGQRLVNELFYTKAKNFNHHEFLLHGDLHHENILHALNGQWVSIDPKGLIGNIAYEIGAFMRNPVDELVMQPNIEQILVNRIIRFSELLNLDQQILIKYSYITTLLGIIWSFEDKGIHWNKWLRLLPILKSMLTNRE